ncbi:glycoside hydrolase superfamily [Russula dissimulans]|nr:glycoside hydrolase superfamily [Russula dissimulans]
MPIGYWSVPSNVSVSPYIPGVWPYIQRAVAWARKYGLHTVIDLHGAPGLQNGYDNSGQRTGSPQSPGFMGRRGTAAVRGYWKNGFEVVRQSAGDDVVVVIGDAFEGVDNWQDFFPDAQHNRVMMDYHVDQIISNEELSRSQDQHIQFACQNLLPNLADSASGNMWTVSGEWSTTITDCALWLNGRGTGARWDGSIGGGGPASGSCDGFTGDYTTFSQDYIAFLRKYWEVQVELGEAVQGWIYWTWKLPSQTESADEWSYQKGLEGGWIPQDPSQRLYPGLCNGN